MDELQFSTHEELAHFHKFNGSGQNAGDGQGEDLAVEGAPSLSLLFYGLAITCVACLGILGNLVSALVLSRPQMRSSVSCLLLGLAFCDTLLISTSILIFGLPAISDYSGTLLFYRLHVYPLWVPYLFPVSISAQTGSVYLTLSVTVERYVAVCYSLHARSLCTWSRARACVGLVLLLAAAYNAPRWFEVCTLQTEFRLEDNSSVYENVMCPLRSSPAYMTYYINWSYLLVMYLIPFLGLVILNWAIYQQVRAANLARAALSKLQRREMGLATMLLFVVGVFLLCNVLPLVNNVLESFYDQSLDGLVQVSNLLVVLNSSVNFVIYCTCGERFRRLLLRLWKDCYCWAWLRRRARERYAQRNGHGGLQAKFGSFRGSSGVGAIASASHRRRRATMTSSTCTVRLIDGDSPSRSPSRLNTIVTLQGHGQENGGGQVQVEELPLHYSTSRNATGNGSTRASIQARKSSTDSQQSQTPCRRSGKPNSNSNSKFSNGKGNAITMTMTTAHSED